MIRVLIFDFDGLILETEEPLFLSWQELYRAYGRDLPLEKWVSYVGVVVTNFDPLTDLEKELGQKLDREQIAIQRHQREMELILKQPVAPGVIEYLETAKRLGLKVGLASNSSCEWVKGHLSRLGLINYFDCIKANNDVQLTKPDPSLYLETLKCLEAEAKEVVAFEDSPVGILAAKRAGLFCVAVPNVMTRCLPINHADMRLESLSEISLEDLLSQIEQKLSL